MIECYARAAASCLPGVGVFVNGVNMLSNEREKQKELKELLRIIALQEKYFYVDAYRMAAKQRAISILEKGQLDAIWGVIGNVSTAAASLVLLKRRPAMLIVVSCILLTLAQGRHLSQNTNILSLLRSS